MTCHWYKFNLSSSCENLLNVNCDQQRQISLSAQSEQHPLFGFFDSRISTDVSASLIMLKLECQWCSCFCCWGGRFKFYLVGLDIHKTHFRMVWLNSKLIILRSAVTYWRAQGVAGSSLRKGTALRLQTHTWLIAWYWFNPILRSTKFWIVL